MDETVYFPAGRYSSGRNIAAKMHELCNAVPRSRVQASWITQHGGTLPTSVEPDQINSDPASCWVYGQRDMDELENADVVLVFTGQGGRHGGRHAELAAALTLKKHVNPNLRIVLIGPRENVYYASPVIEHHATWQSFLRVEILNAAAMAPATPEGVMKVCDNTSVGVMIVCTSTGRHLVQRRKRPPFGTAPAAGHVDEHGSPFDAALAEVREELGLHLKAEDMTKVLTDTFIGNPCRRHHGPAGSGHLWNVWSVEVATEDDVVIAPDKVQYAEWVTATRLRTLIRQTVDLGFLARMRGELPGPSYEHEVGIEAVWALLYHEMVLIDLTPEEVSALRLLAFADPYTMSR